MPVHAYDLAGKSAARPIAGNAGRHGKTETNLHCSYTTRDFRRELHRVQARSRLMKVALILGAVAVLAVVCVWFFVVQN